MLRKTNYIVIAALLAQSSVQGVSLQKSDAPKDHTLLHTKDDKVNEAAAAVLLGDMNNEDTTAATQPTLSQEAEAKDESAGKDVVVDPKFLAS